jgi:hypothetical protein
MERKLRPRSIEDGGYQIYIYIYLYFIFVFNKFHIITNIEKNK